MFAQASYLSSAAVHSGVAAPDPGLAAPAVPSGAGQAMSAAAHHAVETAVKVAEAQAARVQGPVSAVTLNFKFGGDNLGVRLEWRGGVVQTQFRATSPELRAAVAAEWQSMASASPERMQHMAQPVFSQAGPFSGGTASSAGEGGDPQGGGQPAWIGSGGPRSSGASATLPSDETESGRDAAAFVSSAQILDTFA